MVQAVPAMSRCTHGVSPTKCDRNAADESCQKKKYDQGHEGAEHEDITMSKIDHANNAIDHGVADCDQAINRTECKPIDRLLDEILHRSRYPLCIGRFIFARSEPFPYVPILFTPNVCRR